MLLWLQNIVPRRYRLLFQIAVLSIVLHGCVVGIAYVLYRYTQQHDVLVIRSTMHHKNQAIVFMPLAKRIPGALDKVAQTKQGSMQTPVKKKSAVQQKSAKKTSLKKPTSEQKKLSSSKKTSAIKTQQKPSAQPKPEPIKKIEEPKPEPANIVPEEFPTTPLGQPTTEPMQQEIVMMGREDMQALLLTEEVQQELTRVWRPPHGMAKDLVCSVRIAVGQEGAVTSIIIEKSSGVLAYDMSVRMGLAQAVMPKKLWSKEITLTFKQ